MLDPSAAEVIPSGLIKAKTTRRIPYLYSDEQITQLMSKAASLSPPLLAAGIHTLIGLIAVTGLRSGEANALDVEDVCLSEQVMNVTGKYQKRRLVPLHATTVHALADYLEVRANRAAPAGPLFIGATGARLNLNKTRALFRFIVNDCGLQSRPGCGTPRLHDLRHTFAVNTLVDAHRRGDDIDARLAALVNYLGHVDPSSTYWYLTASAELMGIVSERIATYYERSRP